MLPLLNAIVLTATLILLVIEEVRYRKFSERVAETRKELLSIAHQLRSPLAMMRKYQAFLRAHEFGKLSFSQQEAISKMESSLSSSLLLLERLLARSRIETPSLSVGTAHVKLGDVCRAAIAAVEPQAREHSHSIIFKAATRDITIHSDPLILHGILDELLLNAVLYTPPKGTITVTVAKTAQGASIAVKDTGIGVPAGEKKKLFTKYFRGEQAKDMAPGKGLGLAFAQALSQLIGGTVRYAPAGKRGSVFTLSFSKKSVVGN